MKYKKSVYRTFALITQLGISMIVPILLCVWVGGWLEEKFKLPVTILLLYWEYWQGCVMFICL